MIKVILTQSCDCRQSTFYKSLRLVFWLLILWSLVGCVSKVNQKQTIQVSLHVFAAASLSEPFDEIGQSFEAAHPDARVIFNFAGSQQLAQQIIQGAPVDVYASANQKQMIAIIQAGEADNDVVRTFASNRLVVIYPHDHPPGELDLLVLSRENIRLVLAAPEVPVGQYSLEFLERASQEAIFGAGYKEAVLKNVMSYEDNVKGVLSKVALGEADAGIVYASDVTGESTKKVGLIKIPDELNILATYPIVVTKTSENPDLAQEFVDFVLSSTGQGVLEKYNFIPSGK